MDFQRKIEALESKIQQDETAYRHARDGVQAQRLRQILDWDKATLRGYVQQLTQLASQPAQG